MTSKEDVAALKKQLKIKTGVVKRMAKEVTMYRDEEQQQLQKVEKLKADGADGADIRQAEAVLREAQKMTPDAQGRMSKAIGELRDLAVHGKDIAELKEDEDYLKAVEAIEEAEA